MADQIINVQRFYVKNMSYESINTPQIFKDLKSEQDRKLELKISHNKLTEDNLYEVILTLNITAHPKETKDQSIFKGTVDQAGIFQIENFPEDQLDQLLGAYCPSMLYPYASNVISQFSVLGTFPQILLPPLDFNGMYQQRKKNAEKQENVIDENQE